MADDPDAVIKDLREKLEAATTELELMKHLISRKVNHILVFPRTVDYGGFMEGCSHSNISDEGAQSLGF